MNQAHTCLIALFSIFLMVSGAQQPVHNQCARVCGLFRKAAMISASHDLLLLFALERVANRYT